MIEELREKLKQYDESIKELERKVAKQE